MKFLIKNFVYVNIFKISKRIKRTLKNKQIIFLNNQKKIMLLKTPKEIIEFSENLKKLSTYYNYYNNEFNEPIPILFYDDKVFEVFKFWFDSLENENIDNLVKCLNYSIKLIYNHGIVKKFD